MKRIKTSLISFTFILFTTIAFAQDCDCQKNFEWVKKTFEENDAGFQHVLTEKGKQAYEDHNMRFAARVKNVKTLSECTPILYEWLTFFRSGHISIKLNQPTPQGTTSSTSNIDPSKTTTYTIKTSSFKKYLDNKKHIDYEGIWVTDPYTIGIKKDGDKYIGFIIESGAETWKPGQVKLNIYNKDDKAQSEYLMRDHSAVFSENIQLIGKNNLQIGDFTLKRVYPIIDEDAKITQFIRSTEAKAPYIEELNATTLYLRIPSFRSTEKKKIDSVLTANRSKILSTENLIIDIRNGTGGADLSYDNILPLIYTNPIRTIGVEYLSTLLNNQRMIDFINKPEYGFTEDTKKWAQNSFDKLEKKRGQYVNLNENSVRITQYDTIYTYPKNVGIIINHNNGSTDEQFLLAAKQSKKVKLYGTTTHGVLDISNMYFVPTPCNEFQLGYCLTRSMRIPEFTIDEKGIQPDFLLDKTIPTYDWTE